MTTRRSDVLIIGAGPAGCLAATLLCQQGLSVHIIEKARFPRFVIGESLLPQLMSILEKAGMSEALAAAGFQKKDGAVFHRDGQITQFEFADKLSAGPSETYQVKRAEFDQILANCARDAGAEIYFEEQLTAVDLQTGNCQARTTDVQGNQQRYAARHVLDASGYGRVLPRLLGLDQAAASAPRSSIFTHIEDHITDAHYDRDKITILVHPDNKEIWYWLIPFADGSSSLGVVAEPAYLKRAHMDDEAVFRQLVNEEPLLNRLLKDAVYSKPIQRIDAYAHAVTTLHGPGFTLLGNAAAFLDPVFSSGVCIALESAALACPLVIRQLQGESIDWDVAYTKPLMKGVDVFRHYVEAWYDGTLQDIIFHAQSDPQIKRQISAVLAGYAWDESNPFVVKPKKRIALISELCCQQVAIQQSKQRIQRHDPVYMAGLGLVNALGHDKQSVFEQLHNKTRNPLQTMDGFMPNTSVYVGAVTHALPDIPDAFADYRSRNNQLALAALQQIEDEVEMVKATYGPQRVAVIIGTSTSGSANTEADYIHYQKQQEHLKDYRYLQHEIGSVAKFIKAYAGLRSFDTSISTACTSSAKAILSGMHMIRSGLCDAAIVGGVDSLCRLTINGFSALNSLSETVSNPFSVNRQGLNIGEAAALFVLSKKPAAIQLFGGGENSDAHHISAPDPSGDSAAACMRLGLKNAAISSEEIDYLNLHGTGTALNDQMEARALTQVFTHGLACSSSKPLTGHCLGAAGATEAALCWLSLSDYNTHAYAPPHRWDGQADASLPPLNLVDAGTRLKRLAYCMSNSFAFGGNNVSLILGRAR